MCTTKFTSCSLFLLFFISLLLLFATTATSTSEYSLLLQQAHRRQEAKKRRAEDLRKKWGLGGMMQLFGTKYQIVIDEELEFSSLSPRHSHSDFLEYKDPDTGFYSRFPKVKKSTTTTHPQKEEEGEGEGQSPPKKGTIIHNLEHGDLYCLLPEEPDLVEYFEESSVMMMTPLEREILDDEEEKEQILQTKKSSGGEKKDRKEGGPERPKDEETMKHSPGRQDESTSKKYKKGGSDTSHEKEEREDENEDDGAGTTYPYIAESEAMLQEAMQKTIQHLQREIGYSVTLIHDRHHEEVEDDDGEFVENVYPSASASESEGEPQKETQTNDLNAASSSSPHSHHHHHYFGGIYKIIWGKEFRFVQFVSKKHKQDEMVVIETAKTQEQRERLVTNFGRFPENYLRPIGNHQHWVDSLAAKQTREEKEKMEEPVDDHSLRSSNQANVDYYQARENAKKQNTGKRNSKNIKDDDDGFKIGMDSTTREENVIAHHGFHLRSEEDRTLTLSMELKSGGDICLEEESGWGRRKKLWKGNLLFNKKKENNFGRNIEQPLKKDDYVWRRYKTRLNFRCQPYLVEGEDHHQVEAEIVDPTPGGDPCLKVVNLYLHAPCILEEAIAKSGTVPVVCRPLQPPL